MGGLMGANMIILEFKQKGSLLLSLLPLLVHSSIHIVFNNTLVIQCFIEQMFRAFIRANMIMDTRNSSKI